MKKPPMPETLESPKSKAETHKTMGGKVNIYRRGHSHNWQCSTFLNSRNWRVSTHEVNLGRAKVFAEDWYLGLRGKEHAGLLPIERRRQDKKFKEAATKFLEESPLLTQGQRGPTWLKQYELKLRAIILPFLGEKCLAEITSGLIQEYRIWRAQNCKTGRTPTRSTVHKEIVCIRLVLKTASRHGWMEHLPDMSVPYKTSGKFRHRAWFSPEEYQKLYDATLMRAHQPKQKRFKWECEQLHDYVEFAVNTGLRPDEALRLQFGDVNVVEDEASGQTILEIEVRGKRGVGYCKSTEGAVRPFERLKVRVRPDGGPGRSGSRKASVIEGKWHVPGHTDVLFPKWPRELFNAILNEEELRTDRDGRPRTAYSLRHTYICLRLLEGANIYQIAKNCRTSVGTIEKFYAAHLKTQLDAAAINVMRPRPKKKTRSPGGAPAE
ncbi:MAG TPA: site-specific integrase [Acidobacteriaceae bacterium]|jgi:integrase|nr:site-specific integrase [Acidobacteriaceae bacterium]